MNINNSLWDSVRYVVMDVEGNGQDPPDLVELGIVIIENGQITGEPLTWLVRPEAPITFHASRIHGITNKDVASAPLFSTIQREIEQILRDDFIIAHHAIVDYSVMARKLHDWKPKAVLDTLRMARRIVPRFKSYSLDNLITELDIDKSRITLHRAGGDALLAANLFLRLVNHMQRHTPTINDILWVAQLDPPTEEIAIQQRML